MEIYPFVYGRSLKPKEFFNRSGELRRILGRLVTGQSTALIGQPHIGKTSFFNYLMNNESRQNIVGNELDHSIFSYIDSQMLGSNFNQPAFWKQVLIPLTKQFASGKIYETYKTAENNQFGNFTLEQIFTLLGQEGWQFILLLDEFDALLNHPILNSTEFYGGLRSFASRSPGFALVIASRRSLNILNQETQKINPHGSPYFNVFTEFRLGPLPKEHTKTLLDQAKGILGKNDREFILKVSGRHPYLLQAAAAILWEIASQGKHGTDRYKTASDEMYRQTNAHFADTWKSWSTAERKAITAIALAQIPDLVDKHKFSWTKLIENITDYSAELRRLKDAGTIIESGEDNWHITQQAFLWWLADEIKRITRDESSRDESGFEAWICEQEMDGLLTKQERKNMSQAVSEIATKGATTLIESFAKGFGTGI
ncbi:MAG: hypothetical protein GY749_29910 [Desulfobacteraceae bacterium]|nr:hypothetical protein [Desulfobacteraceae bacterium]